jgi:hypothetical protein
LGIRAQHIHLGGDVSAVINNSTLYFAERFVLLDVSQGDETWQIQRPFDSQFTKGELIHCHLDLEQALFFDTETGKRLR